MSATTPIVPATRMARAIAGCPETKTGTTSQVTPSATDSASIAPRAAREPTGFATPLRATPAVRSQRKFSQNEWPGACASSAVPPG